MIVISPGHYPEAPGACYGGACEHDLAMDWITEMYKILSATLPVTVAPAATLKDKVDFINDLSPVFAVELHFNSAEGVAVGREALYYPGSARGMYLADQILKSLAGIFDPNRGSKEGWYRQDHPGQVDYEGDVEGDEKLAYFLRKTKCPSVIVEPQFIQQLHHIRSMKSVAIPAMCGAMISVYKEFVGNAS